MKKNIKYLLIPILIFGIIFKISTVNAEVDPNAKKGDLRCNLNLDKNKYTCIENKTAEGEVWSVELTAKSDDGKLTITKVVTKTTEIGKYDIYFKVKGDVPQNTVKNANVVLLLDTSTSITNNKSQFDTMKNAIINFSKKFSNNPELKGKYKLALVQFAGNAIDKKFVSRQLKDSDFIDKNLGSGSHIEKALEKGIRLLCESDNSNTCNLIDNNASNNIIIFGDGLYANTSYTVQRNEYGKGNGIDEYLPKLKNNENIMIFGALYGGSQGSKGCNSASNSGTCIYINGDGKINFGLNRNWIKEHKFTYCDDMYKIAQKRAFINEYDELQLGYTLKGNINMMQFSTEARYEYDLHLSNKNKALHIRCMRIARAT